MSGIFLCEWTNTSALFILWFQEWVNYLETTYGKVRTLSFSKNTQCISHLTWLHVCFLSNALNSQYAHIELIQSKHMEKPTHYPHYSHYANKFDNLYQHSPPYHRERIFFNILIYICWIGRVFKNFIFSSQPLLKSCYKRERIILELKNILCYWI